MPELDANALTADPEGLAFLQAVLGTALEAAAPDRVFPRDAWTPKPASAVGRPAIAPAPARIEPRFAEALA